MKRRATILGFLLVVIAAFIPLKTADAACVIGGGKSVSATVSFQSFGDEGSRLTVNGKSFFRNKPQCTSPQPSRSYTVSCDEETETLAADSLFAPLCGSREERGKTNSTCWQCGGTVKCDGLDFALGATDPFISQIRNPVSPGDTNMDQVWRIPNASIPNTFTYNGMPYSKPGGDLIACGSNNLACGSSEECTNILHPDVNNRGRSGQKQCNAYSYTRLDLSPGSSTGTTGTVSSGGDKACINIGDYSSHFNELSKASDTFPNGWIYILALPEWMDSISLFIKEHPSNNFMIRLHSPNAELSPDYANRWVTNLKPNAENITNKVYLMPVNEPNNADPNRHVEVDTARVFISALSQGLDNEGLLNTKYIVTSPMIDPTAADVTGYLEDFCADGFCNQFAAVAVAPYGFTGDMSDIKAYFPGAPMIVAETGIKKDGQVVYGFDSETAAFLNSVKDTWGKSAIAACIFSYDPDRNTNQEWIFSAPQTQQALRGLGQSIKPIAAQAAQRKTVRSTISYESCTDTGAPDITSKIIKIPNSISFGLTSTDKQGNKIFSGIKQQSDPRPIKGILGFKKDEKGVPKTDIPKTYERLGRQLAKALPFLTPLAINVQPIVQEYAHTAVTTLCYENDKAGGKTQAFPIKRTITIPAPGLNQLRQNGQMLAGFLAPNVSISKDEYEHLGELNPPLVGNIEANPACDEPPGASTVRKTQVPVFGQEEYSEPEKDWPVYFFSNPAFDTIRNLISSWFGKKCTDVDCELSREPEMSARIKIKTPYIADINRDLVKDQTGMPVGALATLQPAVFQSRGNEPGKVEGQTIEQQVGVNWEDIKNVTINYKDAKTIEREGEQFTNCLLYPTALQKNLDYDCNFSNEQHGMQPVPTELSTAVSNIWRQRWPGETFEGILGQEFLKRYATNLITTQLSQEQQALLMTKIQALINKYVTSGNWPNSQLANGEYQRQIRETASQHGLNETFLYALWVEETHASSVGDYPFGCGGYTEFGPSLNCIVTDPTVQTYLRDPLTDALCMYADGHRNCTFESHPNFVRNLMYYYDYLTNP